MGQHLALHGHPTYPIVTTRLLETRLFFPNMAEVFRLPTYRAVVIGQHGVDRLENVLSGHRVVVTHVPPVQGRPRLPFRRN